jgi:signal transduction histidine kinase
VKPAREIGNPLPPSRIARRAALATSTGWNHALIALAVVTAYVLLEWLSFIHEHKGLPITPWNPGLGLLFALMVLGGPVYAAVLFAGAIAAEIAVLRSNLSWPVIVGISGIIAMGYGAVATIARHNLRLDVGLNHLRDVFVLLIAGIVGALVVALLLSLLLLADTQIDLGDVLLASRPLLVGDIIGIAVVTPLVLRLALHRLPAQWSKFLPEMAVLAVIVAAALWAIVGARGPDGFKLFYFLFLPVVVAAVRHGIDGACIALAVTQLGLVGLLRRYDYDAAAFTEFQTLMLVLSATGLIVGAVVTERQHAFATVREIETRLRAKEAEAAQAARFNLVSGMASALSHEINQPMTAVRALARSAQHILRTPGGDLARADANLTTVIAQIDHASGVVRRMRDFLRRGRPHVSTVEIRGMLEEALTLARAEASARDIRVELDVADDLPLIHGDRIQLEQVVLNLIRNAIDAIAAARRSDGRIRIAARRLAEPARIEIGVADNGPGVADELASRLFDPLTTSKDDGLGLGLPICVSIVESHGGRLWLHERAAGATEFRFSLPLDRSQGAQP